MVNRISEIKKCVKRQKPLIHCITNPISINQCANAILSVGAKPVMAEHPREVCEITSFSDALMLNIGNITDARRESIMLSLKTAKERNIPVLSDVVGVACSRFRREYVFNLLDKFIPSVIKGNYSEIKALQDTGYFSPGVDAEASVDAGDITRAAIFLAKKYKTVVLATGKEDIITDGAGTVYVKNGTEQLARVTGTGCMLGALCTTFMTSATPVDASVSACVFFGICGELAATDKGNGNFMINLMDRISTLREEDISNHIHVEEK